MEERAELNEPRHPRGGRHRHGAKVRHEVHHAGEYAPNPRLLNAHGPESEPCSQSDKRVRGKHYQQIVLYLRVHFLEDAQDVFLARQGGTHNLHKFPAKVIARCEQEVGKQQHNRRFRGYRQQESGLGESIVTQPGGGILGPGRRRWCGVRTRFRRHVRGGALQLIRGFLHILQRCRHGIRGSCQFHPELAGGIREFLDHYRRLAAQRVPNPGTATD